MPSYNSTNRNGGSGGGGGGVKKSDGKITDKVSYIVWRCGTVAAVATTTTTTAVCPLCVLGWRAACLA